MAACRIIKPILRLRPTKCFYRSQVTDNSANACQAEAASLSEEDLKLFERNVVLRKHTNNVPLIRSLVNKLQQQSKNVDLTKRLQVELDKLPNLTHPRLAAYGNEPCELLRVDSSKQFKDAREFSDICKRFNLFRMDNLGNYTGHKSYYLWGPLAMMEQALVQHALSVLNKHQFQLVSVPDILPREIIEGCGMQTEGDRTQVYKLDSEKCLSGTSEMALAGLFADEVIEYRNLPLKVAAVSRCYRAETSGLHEEKGMYRVHQFTKVEMFAICSSVQSEAVLEFFKDIEVSLFRELDVSFRLLDMPPAELGAPAYQKYDIEAWMPGREMWGELSSCSNCTDYQAKRLNIKYRDENNQLHHAHTVNGTAAAVPRLLIALIESNQIGDDRILIPEVLRNYMGRAEITPEKNIPEVKFVKNIKPNKRS